MRCTRVTFLLLAPLLVLVPTAAAGHPSIGQVTVTSNKVFLSTQKGIAVYNSTSQLFPGEKITTAGTGEAQVVLGSKFSCNLGPHAPSSAVVVQPSSGGAASFKSGELTCGTGTSKKLLIITAPGGLTASFRDPLFHLVRTKKQTVVKVRHGVVFVKGPGCVKHAVRVKGGGCIAKAVAVTTGKQVTVPAGGNPGFPTPIKQLTADDKAAVIGLPSAPPPPSPPPLTTTVQGPASPTSSTSATFTFTASPQTAGVTFECNLDGQTIFYTCPSPAAYTGLSAGAHTLLVRALSPTGQTGPPARFQWQVQAPSQQTITITSANPTPVRAGGPDYMPAGTAPGGVPAVTLDSASTGCSLANGTVSFDSPGTCVLDFNQPGNAEYGAAPQLQQSITILPVPYLYWTDEGGQAITRLNLASYTAPQTVVLPKPAVSFAQVPPYAFGLAVDGDDIYWSDHRGNLIGRETLDQSVRNGSFLDLSSTGAIGIAVRGGYLYWANYNANAIGRVSLNGKDLEPTFIAGAHSPYGVAVDANYVYWTNGGTGTIGRATLAGGGIDQNFITGASDPEGIAVDAKYVYWSNAGNGTIGRVTLDGRLPDQRFITGANLPIGIAIGGGMIYWANYGANSIGAASLNGGKPDPNFVSNVDHPYAVAVSGASS